MNIKQSVEEKESIQSLSIRITHLFNGYKQLMNICLKEQEKVEYFIESLFPSYKEQLNNQYQSADGVSYVNCSFKDVLATALKLERNARVFEEDVKILPSGVSQLQINAVYKPVNSTTQLEEKEEVKFNKIAEEGAFEIKMQNAQDIKKIQKEQGIMKDQLEAVTSALQNFGDEMKLMRQTIENLCYERVDCPGTSNPMYNHGSNPPFKHKDSRNFNNYSFTKRYDDPRLYNASRANDGRLQGICYKCGRKGHYANVCRVQTNNSSGLKDQAAQHSNVIDGGVQSERLQEENTNLQRNISNDVRVSGDVNRGPVTRSVNANTNQVSVINHTVAEQDEHFGLLNMNGMIADTKLTNIIFDSGAAVSCLSAAVFHNLDPQIKSKLTRCKQKQLTNATGEVMTSLGELKISVELNGPEPSAVFKEVSVIVVSNLQSEMLFSANAVMSDKFRCYKVDFDRNCIVFTDRQDQVTQASINIVSDQKIWKPPIPVYHIRSIMSREDNLNQSSRSMSVESDTLKKDCRKIEAEKKKFKKPFKESVGQLINIDIGRVVVKLKRYEKKRKKKNLFYN
jgi:hypothetical protein